MRSATGSASPARRRRPRRSRWRSPATTPASPAAAPAITCCWSRRATPAAASASRCRCTSTAPRAPSPATTATRARPTAAARTASARTRPSPTARCARAGMLKVKLLGFNDFHGQLAEGRLVAGRPVGGAAVLASYLRAAQARLRERSTIIVHAGDHVGASPPDSALLQDEPAISSSTCWPTTRARYTDSDEPGCNVVGTLGNHEFDEGKAELLRLLDGRQPPDRAVPGGPVPRRALPLRLANVVDEVTRRDAPAALRGQAGSRRAGGVHRRGAEGDAHDRHADRRRRPAVPGRGRRHQRVRARAEGDGRARDRRDHPPGRHADVVHRPDAHDRRRRSTARTSWTSSAASTTTSTS